MPDRYPSQIALTAEDKDHIRLFWEVYDAHFDEVSTIIRQESMSHPELGPLLKAMPDNADTSSAKALLREAVIGDQWQTYIGALKAQGAQYAYANISLRAWFSLLPRWRSYLIDQIIRKFGSTPDRLVSALHGMNRFTEILLEAIAEAYIEAKEDTITKQRSAILELSTPVLPVRDGLLIMPLIGVLDTHRAQQVTHVLLHAIRDYRAKIVVMDITGVPVVDSRVANHLIQSVDAARLMGAQVILTGLSPEVAQALVTVGINLSRVNTQSDLQGGIEEAHRILRYRVVKIPENGYSNDNASVEA